VLREEVCAYVLEVEMARDLAISGELCVECAARVC
jgi:hypothetical protein